MCYVGLVGSVTECAGMCATKADAGCESFSITRYYFYKQDSYRVHKYFVVLQN